MKSKSVKSRPPREVTLAPLYKASASLRDRMLRLPCGTEVEAPPCSILTTDIWRHGVMPYFYDVRATTFKEQDENAQTLFAATQTCRVLRFIVERDVGWFAAHWMVRHRARNFVAKRRDEHVLNLYNAFFLAIQTGNLENIKKFAGELATLPVTPANLAIDDQGAIPTPAHKVLFSTHGIRSDKTTVLGVLMDLGWCDPRAEPLFRYLVGTKCEKAELEKLWDLGCTNVNVPGLSDGVTALHAAVYADLFEVGEWLLGHGADPTLRTTRQWYEKIESGVSIEELIAEKPFEHRMRWQNILAVHRWKTG